MSSACQCHIDGAYCFYCEVYAPVVAENEQLKGALRGIVGAIDRGDLAQTRMSSGTDYVIHLAREAVKDDNG